MLRGGRWVKSVFTIGVLMVFFNGVKLIQIPGDEPVGSMLVPMVLGGFSVELLGRFAAVDGEGRTRDERCLVG
jgi:hypothetical protein